MMVGSTRNKDSRESWIFLAITGFVIGYAAGPVDNFGILVVVFVDYYNETNTKIGRSVVLPNFMEQILQKMPECTLPRL
jgi:hypothetical protein